MDHIHIFRKYLRKCEIAWTISAYFSEKNARKNQVTKLFPIILIGLDIGATVVYLCFGDWKHGIYWFAAATLTATVTF